MIAASIVAVSFVFFAVDQMTEGSENQVRNLQDDGSKARSDVVIDQPSPPARIERIREQSHSSVRELIDDGNDVLVAPFAEHRRSRTMSWVERLVPLAIGLVLYGRAWDAACQRPPQRPARGRGLARGARVAPETRLQPQLSCFSPTLSTQQDS